MSSFKRLLKSFSANIFSQIINVANQIILIPFFLQNWGSELYGEWIIISTLPNVLLLNNNLGFGTAGGNEVVMLKAKSNIHEASTVYFSVFTLIFFLSILMFFIGLLATLFLDINDYFDLTIISKSDFEVIFLLFILKVGIEQLCHLLTVPLTASDRYDLGVNIRNFTKLLEVLLICLFLSLGYLPKIIAVIGCSTSFISLVLLFFSVRIKSNWLKFQFSFISFHAIRRLIRPASSFMLFQIVNAISVQGTVLVVGALLPKSDVVLFSTTRTLINLSKQVLNIFNLTFWPEVSKEYGNMMFEKVKRLYKILFQLNMVSVIIISLILSFFGSLIMEFWLGENFQFNFNFFILMVISNLISSVWFASSLILYSTNNHEKLALINFATASLTVLSSLILVKYIGIIGIPIGLIIGECVIAVWSLIFTGRLVQMSVMELLNSLFSKELYLFSKAFLVKGRN